MTKTKLLSIVILAAAACGSTPDICNTTACASPSTKTYQVCTNISTTVETVKYGNQSCQCDTAVIQSSQCVACGAAITSFCKM